MNATTEVPAVPTAAPGSSLEELLAELLPLSADKKLEVIARLAQSLKSAFPPQAAADQQPALPAFVGAWANDPEANEMEQAIISIRHPVSEPELK